MATQTDAIQTYSLATWHGPLPPAVPKWEAALWKFAGLVGRNPQVLAVVADGGDSEVAVWTYFHSDKRADRSAIYAAEAQALLRNPGTFFDFNAVLRPGGLTEGDLEGTVFYYESDYGDANSPSKQGSA
jgi:hypothetical protein